MSNDGHDMGGMHGFGRLSYDSNEPVFHEPWKSRMYAMMMCFGPHDVFGSDGLRAALESQEPPTYLGSTYYEGWMKVIERALLAKGFLMKEELDSKTEHFKEHADEVPTRREDPVLAKQTVDVVWGWNTPTRVQTLRPGSARPMLSEQAGCGGALQQKTALSRLKRWTPVPMSPPQALATIRVTSTKTVSFIWKLRGPTE